MDAEELRSRDLWAMYATWEEFEELFRAFNAGGRSKGFDVKVAATFNPFSRVVEVTTYHSPVTSKGQKRPDIPQPEE